MAGGTNNIVFERSLVLLVNRNKISTIYDYPFGDYIAQRGFFDELSRVQKAMIEEGKVKLNTGQEIDLNSLGGMVALNIYMETLESTRESMIGLTRLGLGNEKKLWQLQ